MCSSVLHGWRFWSLATDEAKPARALKTRRPAAAEAPARPKARATKKVARTAAKRRTAKAVAAAALAGGDESATV